MTTRQGFSIQGFSILETIIAIAVCGIVLAALASVNVSSLQQARFGNQRVQATQVLDTIGRRVVGGQDLRVIPDIGQVVEFGFGDLGEIADLTSSAVTDRFRARVAHEANISVGASAVGRSRIEVCFEAGSGEQCVTAFTLSRSAS
jgi:type II secretory pathway pseudopilin PulG